MHRLTVSLPGMVPRTRRQVEVPSDLTLAGLHEVIVILFDWGGDHLHEFTIGRRRYADPDWVFGGLLAWWKGGLESDDVPLAEVAWRPGKVIGYTYDLGACWTHRITVDAVQPADPDPRVARCVAGSGPHPAEYDDDQPVPFDLAAVNRRLAKLPLLRAAPRPPSTPTPAPPETARLAAAARRTRLLDELVRLARWAATPRAVTPPGMLRKREVAGALDALGLPGPPPGLHSAASLPYLDTRWKLACDLDLVDLGAGDALSGRALALLDDDRETVALWTRMWELAALDGRAVIEDGRVVAPWIASGPLDALWAAQRPLTTGEVAGFRAPAHDPDADAATGRLLDQLADVGGVERLPDGRWQLTPLARHAREVEEAELEREARS